MAIFLRQASCAQSHCFATGSQFRNHLRQAKILILEILNVFLRLKS